MKRYKQFFVITLITITVVFSVAAMHPPPLEEFKNLKILPKDISSEALHKIMEIDFGKGLGVNCDYCHARNENGGGLYFPSDAKSEKEIARKMMRMTMDLNQKYFGSEKPVIGDSLAVITCITCHRGEPYPAVKKEKPKKPYFGI